MTANVYFKRSIQAILMPAFVWGMQAFFKFAFSQAVAGIGVPFAAIALSQIFPFIFYENFIMLKVYALKVDVELKDNKYIEATGYKLSKEDSRLVQFYKYLTYAIFLVILSLFIITLGLANKPGFVYLHNFTGGAAILISILYLIFV